MANHHLLHQHSSSLSSCEADATAVHNNNYNNNNNNNNNNSNSNSNSNNGVPLIPCHVHCSFLRNTTTEAAVNNNAPQHAITFPSSNQAAQIHDNNMTIDYHPVLTSSMFPYQDGIVEGGIVQNCIVRGGIVRCEARKHYKPTPQLKREEGERIRYVTKRCCLRCGAFFLLNLTFSVTLTILLLRFVNFSSMSSSLTEQRNNLCLPCSQGKGVASDDDGRLCCVFLNETQTRQLIIEGVKLTVLERLKDDDLYNLLNRPLLGIPTPINRNAAHVYLATESDDRWRSTQKRKTSMTSQDDDDYQTLTSWKDLGGSHFIREGIEYNATKGHFKVTEAGIYVIYSRLVYDYDDDVIDDVDVMTFGQTISLSVRGDTDNYRKLLEDEQTQRCIVGTTCYNSQIFSTLYLSRNSQIAVRAKSSKYISQKFQSSYFGLYKID